MWDVHADPLQKREMPLIYKAFITEIPAIEGHGITSEVKSKLEHYKPWEDNPLLDRCFFPSQGWVQEYQREAGTPSVYAGFAHMKQSVPAVPQNRNLSPSEWQKGFTLRPWFCLQC